MVSTGQRSNRPSRSSSTPDAHAASAFRLDIEGLRGVAVLLVVAFHAQLAVASGGFVGVDVFFVISGFLITGQLMKTVEGTGTVGLVEFWSRRVGRLVPLLLATILVTLAACRLVYSPLAWSQQRHEAFTSALYISNIDFARSAQAYFQSGSSPFLHTWSLAVEEQFYVAWPLLFLVLARLTKLVRRPARQLAITALLATTAASFLASYALTRRGTPWAFYSMPTRAWEFGIGGLTMVLGSSATRRVPAAVRAAAGWLALVAIVGAAASYDELTKFPGLSALVPAGATAALLWVGAVPTAGAPSFVLSLRPLRSLGRVSYAWYLLHWPAIVLTIAASNKSSTALLVTAAAASLLAAYPMSRWVERPARTAARSSAPGRVLAAGIGATVVVLLVTATLQWDTDRGLRDPYLAHLQDVRHARSTSGSADCATRALDGGITVCVHNAEAAGPTVLLLGDSHAAQWAAALEAEAIDRGFRLVVQTYGGCPSLKVNVRATGQARAGRACLAFRDATDRLLPALRPDLVVLANADFTNRMLRTPTGGLLTRTQALTAWTDAAADFSQQLRGLDIPFVVIENNPSQTQDPIECLARHRADAMCAASAPDAVARVGGLTAAQNAGWGTYAPRSTLRSADLMCDASHCHVEIEGTVVYADADHLSREFTMARRSAVTQLVRQGLPGS